MKCNQCGLENPKQSKFCRNCGEAFGVRLRCPECGSENPGDSIFCTQCGEKLLRDQKSAKSAKGTQRKCKNCGRFNDLDVFHCVQCGEKMVSIPKEHLKRQSTGPSYRTIALVIGTILLAGLCVKLGITFSKRGDPSYSAPIQASTSSINVDEAQVIAVAKNFKCACEKCGELPLVSCQCELPRGSVEEKKFIREKLAEGFTVEQVIEQLDKTYGHRA
jgi:ribosomal protein L40E